MGQYSLIHGLSHEELSGVSHEIPHGNIKPMELTLYLMEYHIIGRK